MPCLEIIMPRTDTEMKAKIARLLTDVFDRETQFGAEIFGIHFIEYDFGDTASGGKIIDKNDSRPYLHFKLFIPRINRATKSALVKGFSSVFAKAVNNPLWLPVIHICEHAYDNVGAEGDILSQKIPELAERAFYYDLSE